MTTTRLWTSSWLAAALVAALAGLSLTAAPRAVFAVEAGSAYSDAELQAVMTDDEAKIADLRNQELSALRITLGRRQPQHRMADLYFRLAELYLEAYRAEFLLEGRVHERRRVEGKPAGFINRARSKVFLLSGVKACNEILNLRIAYNKLDRVYYFLGVNSLELEDRKEALKNFEYLTRKFPSSPFVSDAYRELGDSEFEKKEFAKAQAYYEMAVKRETGDTLPRLLHKLAWTYYRTRQFDRAVETMKEAISRTGRSGRAHV